MMMSIKIFQKMKDLQSHNKRLRDLSKDKASKGSSKIKKPYSLRGRVIFLPRKEIMRRLDECEQ